MLIAVTVPHPHGGRRPARLLLSVSMVHRLRLMGFTVTQWRALSRMLGAYVGHVAHLEVDAKESLQFCLIWRSALEELIGAHFSAILVQQVCSPDRAGHFSILLVQPKPGLGFKGGFSLAANDS